MMEKIIFEDLPSTKTPLNANNLNKIQENVENAINDLNKNLDEEIVEVNKKLNYSTQEQKIGEWIDGKATYRTVFYFGTLPTNNISGTLSVPHNIKDIDFITKLYGIAFNRNSKHFKTIPYVDPWTIGKSITLEANTTNVAIKTDSVQNDYEGYVIFEYTKTTD